jgi:ABC-type multidrug transport system ATPase subunit
MRLDKPFSIAVNVDRISFTSVEGALTYAPFSIEMNQDQNHCCVTGPSGSGKTIFLKCLLPRFVQDYIRYEKAVIDTSININKDDFYGNSYRIGYASQYPYFIAHKSVYQNLLAPFVWGKLELPKRQDVFAVINDFFIQDILKKKAYKLSGGEKQRVNLARMFLARPQIAIIDECLSALDEALSQEIASNIVAKYSNFCKILITGHRAKDLIPFSGLKLLFSFIWESPGAKNIIVRVTHE